MNSKKQWGSIGSWVFRTRGKGIHQASYKNARNGGALNEWTYLPHCIGGGIP